MSKRTFFILTFLLQTLRLSTQLRSINSAKALDYGCDGYEAFSTLISVGYRPPKVMLAKYMVSIRTARPTAYFGDNHYCAGVIIAARTIVTAAHCVVDSHGIKTRPGLINVVAGTPIRLRLTKCTIEVGVEEVIPHEKYVRRVKNDIAVLRLKTALPDNNELIKISILARGRIATGKNCSVLGWGQLFHNGPYSNVAISSYFTILPDSKCRRTYSQFFLEGMLCAGDPKNWGKSVCRGDSGSPLICDGLLYGIVSWSDTSGKENVPFVLTDMAYYRDWVLKVGGMEGL